jgi:hypothetical protein
MTKQTQKEAVFQAVTNVLTEAGIAIEGNVSVHMTREYRSQVNNILFESFRGGSIELDREFSDSELKAYVSGLQSNWLRKDKRLNGNVAYVAKNPGSRAGSGDAQLKAMRALLSTLTVGTPDYTEVETCISVRVKEIQSTKISKAKSIDFSALPAELRTKFQK